MHSLIEVIKILTFFQDKYVLAAMILLTSVCIWHGITTAIKFPEKSEKGEILENIALGTLAGLYFLFNLIFVIRIYSVVSTASIV